MSTFSHNPQWVQQGCAWHGLVQLFTKYVPEERYYFLGQLPFTLRPANRDHGMHLQWETHQACWTNEATLHLASGTIFVEGAKRHRAAILRHLAGRTIPADYPAAGMLNDACAFPTTPRAKISTRPAWARRRRLALAEHVADELKELATYLHQALNGHTQPGLYGDVAAQLNLLVPPFGMAAWFYDGRQHPSAVQATFNPSLVQVVGLTNS